MPNLDFSCPAGVRFIAVGRNLVRADLIEAAGLGPDEMQGDAVYCRVLVFTGHQHGTFSTEAMLKSDAKAELDRIVSELERSHA